MKGNKKVVTHLNDALQEELTAINQYFLHAEMCHNWGYHRLGDHLKQQAIGEMRHAEKLIERILFLEGTPAMEPMTLRAGETVKAQLQSDLDLERKAVAMYNDAISTAREADDDGSRELFTDLLKDEEQHVDWLETQLHIIEEVSYERYLAQQMEGGKS